jgi:hypothetical protein
MIMASNPGGGSKCYARSSESSSSGEQNSDKDTRPAEWVTGTSLVQKGTIQLLVGLDHSREPVLDDTVASNWEADRFVDSS